MALYETRGSVKQPARYPPIYESPVSLLIVIVLSAFVFEALLMIALRFISLPPWWEVIFDASLLIILVFPILYLFLFRPLILHIGDRRRAEEETRLAFAELKQIFDTAADGMRLVDKDFNVLQVNETFAGMADVDKDEVIGRKCHEVFGGPLCHTPDCPLIRVLHGEQRVELEIEKYRKDGTRTFCILTATPFRDLGGRLIGIVEDFKDISDRRQWEEKLRESEAEKQAILDASVDVIMQVDSDMRLVWVNKMAGKVADKAAQDFMGHKCYEFLRNSDSVCAGCPCEKALESGKTERRTIYYPASEGEDGSYWETFGVPLTGEDSEVAGVIEIARDITEKVEADDALIQAKEDWENTFDAITDMVMLLDSQHRIIRVNEATAKALGTTKENLVGKKCYEAVHDQEYTIAGCPLISTMKTSKACTREISEACGGRTYLCSTSPIFDDKKTLRGYTHSLKDITESKRLEAQLQQAQKMEAIGTLAGGIAHDFNNILQATSGYVELLIARKSKDDPDLRYLGPISKSVARASELVQRLLVFSRRVESEQRPVDLNAEVVQVQKLLASTLPKMIDIELDLADDLEAVSADPLQIEQILMNLGVNARDAMPEGGKLVFKTKAVTLDAQFCNTHLGAKQGDYVRLTVQDTGCGIDKEAIEHIFEPFYTTKEMGKGTGLGLAVVYGIVENHGGYIECTSIPGKGAAFDIYFPVSSDETDRSRLEPFEGEKAVLGRGETVLLVDDEKSLLDVGRDMLEVGGYVSLVAESGENAIEIYKREKARIDLVILDMAMPGMGGYRCFEEFRALDPDLRIIVASGYAAGKDVEKILESSGTAFVRKPYRLADMLKTVRRLLDEAST
jgi:two-component system cell cycle sensor histidine kinase/response regulator CckA